MGEPPGRPEWFSQALAYRPEFVEAVVDGTVVRARCWGPSGPGIVLIHGGAAHGAWWDHIGPLLSADKRVVAVDLSGHGSSGRRAEYNFQTWAVEVAALSAAGAITGSPILVGHSMGGYVALALGAGQTETASGVVLIDSAVPGRVPESAPYNEAAVPWTPRRYATKDEAVRRFRVTPADPYVLPYVTAHVAAESVEQVEGGWTWKFDPRAQRRDRIVSNELLFSLAGRLAILRAEHGLITRRLAARMVDAYGRAAPVIELPGTGHHVLLDDPIALVVALRALTATWDSIPS